MKKIGIFVGVFNPPHNFHFTIAQNILNEQKNFEKIIFVPTGNKYNKPQIIDAFHRYNMLKIVCDNNPLFEVSKIEIEAEEQPYTYQTLDLFSKIYKRNEIHLIIGSDNIKEFNHWKEYEYILNTYKPIVYERGYDKLPDMINKYEFLKKHEEHISKAKCDIYTNLNSSFIREKVSDGKNVSYLLPETVYRYIIENNLYINN